MKTKLIFNPNIPNWTTYPYTFWDNWYTDEELEKLKAYCVKAFTASVINPLPEHELLIQYPVSMDGISQS